MSSLPADRIVIIADCNLPDSQLSYRELVEEDYHHIEPIELPWQFWALMAGLILSSLFVLLAVCYR